ncbi:MAG: hypothetical protein ACYTBJ_22605 [Planctomycetota bacterium]|jgi:hypothetical protein
MSALAKIVGYALIGAAIPIVSGGCREREAAKGPDSGKTYDGNSYGLNCTVIVPTVDSAMKEGSNVIWCSSFQIAWNELKDNIVGAPVQVAGAEEIAGRLNSARQSRADVPDGSYYAASGFARDGIVQNIQKEMAGRFPTVPAPQFEAVMPDHIIAYSYLAANVKFKIPFFENREELLFKNSRGNATAVTSFGIRPEDDYAYRRLRGQVEILFLSHDPNSYRLEEFGLDLCKFTKPNQIVLARIEPRDTLAETVAALEQKISQFPKEASFHEFGINDVLLIPNMFWRIMHHFAELEGKYLRNKSYEGYWIKEAVQMVQFKLDRSGAELASEAKLHVAPIPNHFVFDEPFLIYIKKRGAHHPFFVMWVDNAELLARPQTESNLRTSARGEDYEKDF